MLSRALLPTHLNYVLPTYLPKRRLATESNAQTNRPGCMYKLTRLLNRWQNCWDLFKLLLCLGHFFRGVFRFGLGLIGFFQSTQSRYFIIGCNVSFSRQTSFSFLQFVCEWSGCRSQFRCWFLTFDCLFFDDTGFFGSFFGNFLTLKKKTCENATFQTPFLQSEKNLVKLLCAKVSQI